MPENGNRELGELATKVDTLTAAFRDFREEIRRGRQEDKEWRDLHDGQGERTTHKQMWRSISEAHKDISQVKTRASFFGTLGGAISAALSVLGIKIFGGGQ